MLVLRTNSGYDRWYEARKLWGGIVNQSRNLTVQGLVYGPHDEKWREQFMKWTAAFPHVARHSLRGERNLDDVAKLLGPDMPLVTASTNMPLIVAAKICTLLHEAVQSGEMDRFAFLQAEKERSQLIDHMGACERILKTPLASVYSVEIRRFLFAYLITLPLGMVDQVGMWTPLFIMVVAYPLLSLDQIGVDLQNPFSKLRLSHHAPSPICRNVTTRRAALWPSSSKKANSERNHPARCSLFYCRLSSPPNVVAAP